MLTIGSSENLKSPERIAVEMECDASGKRVRLRVERYDDKMGWYPSGCMSLPLNQLPLLEQAIADMRQREQESENECEIIPFPLMNRETSALPCAEHCKEPCQAALAPRFSESETAAI